MDGPVPFEPGRRSDSVSVRSAERAVAVLGSPWLCVDGYGEGEGETGAGSTGVSLSGQRERQVVQMPTKSTSDSVPRHRMQVG